MPDQKLDLTNVSCDLDCSHLPGVRSIFVLKEAYRGLSFAFFRKRFVQSVLCIEDNSPIASP